MDPNAALAEIRRLYGLAEWTANPDLQELGEKVEALDDWLTSGGFLPDEWSTRRAEPS